MSLSFSNLQRVFSPIKNLFQPRFKSPIPEEDIIKPRFKKKKKRIDLKAVKRLIPSPKEYIRRRTPFTPEWKEPFKRIGEKETPGFPFTAKEGFFVTEREPKDTAKIKEFFKPEEYLGGRVGKGFASMVETGLLSQVGTAKPPALGEGVKVAFSKFGALRGATSLTAFHSILQKMKGEEIAAEDLIASGVIGAIFGSVQPKPLSGASTTDLGAARRTLGIKPGATPEQIKKAYYSLARQNHPDVGGSVVKMTEVNRAFEYLTSVKPNPTFRLPDIKSWLAGLWSKPKPTGKEIVKVKTDAIALVKQAIKMGDTDGAKALYTEFARNVKLPKFEEIVTPPSREIIKIDKEPLLIKPKEQVSLLKSMRSGTGRFEPGELYTQIGKPEAHKIIIQGMDKAGNIIGNYIHKDILSPATFKPEELQPLEVSKGATRFVLKQFGIEKPIVPEIPAEAPKPQSDLALEKNAMSILDEIGSPRTGLPGKVLNQEELNIVGDYLRKTGGDKLRGKIARDEDVVFGTIKDRRWKGETEYLVMAKKGPTKGRFRLHGTPMGSKFFDTKITGEVAKPKRPTVAKLEKEAEARRFTSYLEQAPDQDEYIRRVKVLSEDVKKPEVKANKKRLARMRATVNKEIARLGGFGEKMGWKTGDYAQMQMLKKDPELGPSIESLETLRFNIDRTTGGTAQKNYETVARDLGLPAEGKFYIPYGKYTTRGTGNLEWVRENTPLLYMGNKRGMLGYALDVLGIKQKDLGNIVPSDASHLKEVTNVVDLFGGSGLLSNLSKKFFPGAKITYNELDPKVLRAIEKVKKDPKTIQRFVSEVAKWLHDKPGADWLTHFNTVYKGDPDFLTAAKLIEASAGRTDLTPRKMQSLIKAIPNFSKTFKGIDVSNKDALGLIDKHIREGTSKDFLWIDPPYLWSTGYEVGAKMEKAKGFLDLLDKLEKLNDKGVKFVFFNNDPEVQVEKAGREAIHLENIIGRINKLSERGMIVVRGVNPIGAAKRREMMITNLEHGLENSRLLNLKELQKSIEEMRGDPAAAPREVLKMYRDIIGTSQFAPEGERITYGQIKTIRTLRKRLRIKNRELIPLLDELLGDTSFAKMTREDGKKMIEWLQPRNWDVIESKVKATRELTEKERRQGAIIDRFTSKQPELEKKFGLISKVNKTLSEMEDLAKVIEHLPPVTKYKPNVVRKILSVFPGFGGKLLPEEAMADLLKMDLTFHAPMVGVFNISKSYESRMKDFKKLFKPLSDKQRTLVVNKQAGMKVKGLTPEAKRVAEYWGELTKITGKINNRLAVAVGDKPMPLRDPYWPYILDQSIIDAANIGESHRFTEQRLSTAKDFKAGVFDKDPERVIDLWARASGNWLKKRLFKALLQSRYDALFEHDYFQSTYARAIVNYDIHNQLPELERWLKAGGREINKLLGKAYPKKVKISDEWKDFILNSIALEDLHANAREGYMTIPRAWGKMPNVSLVFARVFYPAKLCMNFLFGLKNLTQQFQALPFTGMGSYLDGWNKWIKGFFPTNLKETKTMIKVLKQSGYEFGRISHTMELPKSKGKVVNVVDSVTNVVNDVTEFVVRTQTADVGKSYVDKKARETGVKVPEKERERIAAELSAFIHYIPGKGHAPLGQRTTPGRIGFTFLQYPLNTLHKCYQMLEYGLSDKRAKEIWQTIAVKGYSPEAYKMFKDASPGSRARLYLLFLAFGLSAGIVYGVTGSWKAAEDTLPGKPRIVPVDSLFAFYRYYSNPNEDTLNDLKQTFKSLWSVAFIDRMSRSKSIKDYGLFTTRSGRPTFIENKRENVAKQFFWGSSSLEEYEKRFPSALGKLFGGYKQAGKVKKLERERKKIRKEETKAAVDFMKKLPKFKTADELVEYVKKTKEEGKFTEGMKKKLKQYYKEQATGVGGLERSIAGLKDEDQARFILDEIKKTKTSGEVQELISRYKQQGIWTDNVKKELKRIAKEGL